MNNCYFIAPLLTDPESRFTADTQTNVAQCRIEISGYKEDDTSALTVRAWRNQAEELMKLKAGDRACFEGRLQVDRVEKNGYKETVVQLVASRIYPLSAVKESVVKQLVTAGAKASGLDDIPF